MTATKRNTLPCTATIFIPGLDGQFVFSGLGSKGVTTSPWSAAQLAGHLVCGTDLPPDLLPAALWK